MRFTNFPFNVYYTDNYGIERIGIALCYIDSKFIKVRENSYTTLMILDKDLEAVED